MSNKRQRTTTSTESLGITNLPDGLLVGIASYLANPSVVLFSFAFSPNSQQTETETSKAIISATNWSVLDFGDIEKSLAVELSDNDIDKILRCIDAVNNVQILKLAGCVGITGVGLNTLRSSIVIQQIDMSLVGKHESPLIEPEPLLSQSVVLPILDEIISKGRESSLKQLELPKKWRSIEVESAQMDQFIVRYNDYLTNQRYCCSNCKQVIDRDHWVCLDGDEWHGTQNYICSQCLNHVCYDDDCEDESSLVNWCTKCEKGYCPSCVTPNKCDNCALGFCNGCEEMKKCKAQGYCTRSFCGACSEKSTCSYCGFCNSCNVTEEVCKSFGCQKTICNRCCVIFTEGAEGYCKECGL